MRLPLVLLFVATLPAHAADRVFESGPQRTHLIELFTSQGCSSCPPAEAWLSKLKTEPRLWKDFVPIAFHVDYWTGSAGAIRSRLWNGLHANRVIPNSGKARAFTLPVSFSMVASGWNGACR